MDYIRLTVGISDMKIAKRPREVLVTHSLGSCLGLSAYDPKLGLGGLIHCLLPTSRTALVENPFMYVNLGVPIMIRRLISLGAVKSDLVFKAAGCAAMMRIINAFDTGAHNCKSLKNLFAKNGVTLAAQDTGGSIPRTMYLYNDTGRVVITSQGKEWEL